MCCLRRVIPCSNCVGHELVEKSLVTYGYEVNVRWSGEGFGDCNDVLFLPDWPLKYSVYFAPSERLPVVVSILYSKPDLVEKVDTLVIRDVRGFMECLFNYAEIFARDVVAIDYVPRTKEFFDEAEGITGGPKYVVNRDSLYEDLLTACRKLCEATASGAEMVEEVALGPEISSLKRVDGLAYSIWNNLMYIHDGVNSLFIDVRVIDPFEIGEEYLLIVYGIYRGKELAYASYLGEESVEEEHYEELIRSVKDIVRKDGRLKHPSVIAKKIIDIIESKEVELEEEEEKEEGENSK